MYQRNNCVITLKFSVNDQSRASRGVSSDRTLLGAPFIPTPPFAYTRRGDSYIVRFRKYVVERIVAGERHCGRLELLRCEDFFVAECPAFAYKYHGYIYEYGFHSHWDPWKCCISCPPFYTRENKMFSSKNGFFSLWYNTFMRLKINALYVCKLVVWKT